MARLIISYMFAYHKHDASYGFALPTVVIATVVMFMILVAAVGGVTSVRSALDSQFYDEISRDTMETASQHAADCLAAYGYIASWSDASPLHPNTNCSGGAACTNASNCYVVKTPTYASTYTINGPVDNGTGVQQVTINVTVSKLAKSSGAVAQTSTSSSSVALGGMIKTNSVNFGYRTGCGTFFVTVSSDGKGRATGANVCSQLGNGTTTNSLTPSIINLPTPDPIDTSLPKSVFTNFLNIGAGIGVITTSGKAYFSGSNSSGQQGINSTVTSSTFKEFPLPLTPAGNSKIASGQAQKAVYLANTLGQSYVITDKGYVYAAGGCSNGELGEGSSGSGCMSTIPVLLTYGASGLPWPNPSDRSTIPISLDGDSSIRNLIMQDGSYYAWGYSPVNALGVNQTGIVASPQPAVINGQTTCTTGSTCPLGAGPNSRCVYGATQNHCVVKVGNTGRTTYILLNDGSVWSTGGDNSWGMLGIGTNSTTTAIFRKITGFPADGYSHVATDIYADAWQVVMITKDGNVYTVGRNDTGVAGCGTPSADTTGACPGIATSPVRMKLPSGVSGVSIYNTSVGFSTASGNSSAEADNTYVIADNGKVYGAGDNTFGQIGNGCALSTPLGPDSTCATTLIGTPTVMNFSGAPGFKPASIVSGRGTTIIQSTAGVIYTVGLNDYGQLGDGTTINSSKPKANPYLNTIKPILY